VNDKDAAAAAAVSQLSAALAPMGCLIGIVQALFWLVMIGLIIFCAWLWSLR
jgi:hypothetical protein